MAQHANSNRQMFVILGTIALVVVSFVAGVGTQKYVFGKTNTPAAQAAGPGQQGGQAGGGRGFGARGGGTEGTVESVASDSMTVKTAADTATVSLSDSTTVSDGSTQSASSISAIKTGDTVLVIGSKDSDGTVAASRIILNPPTRSQQPSSGSSSNGV